MTRMPWATITLDIEKTFESVAMTLNFVASAYSGLQFHVPTSIKTFELYGTLAYTFGNTGTRDTILGYKHPSICTPPPLPCVGGIHIHVHVVCLSL